jgi:hypothetical protein
MAIMAYVRPYSRLSLHSTSIFGSRQDAVMRAFCFVSCVGASVIFWSDWQAQNETSIMGYASSPPEFVEPAIGVAETFWVRVRFAGHCAFDAASAMAGPANAKQAIGVAGKGSN